MRHVQRAITKVVAMYDRAMGDDEMLNNADRELERLEDYLVLELEKLEDYLVLELEKLEDYLVLELEKLEEKGRETP